MVSVRCDALADGDADAGVIVTATGEGATVLTTTSLPYGTEQHTSTIAATATLAARITASIRRTGSGRRARTRSRRTSGNAACPSHHCARPAGSRDRRRRPSAGARGCPRAASRRPGTCQGSRSLQGGGTTRTDPPSPFPTRGAHRARDGAKEFDVIGDRDDVAR